MHLTQLKIHALPGIDPGFEFQPPAKGVNLVTGPNAIGKSSLVRALAHLLQPQKGDPPALSLEAEFRSGDASLQVRRNGNQVVWTRNGETADRPALPAAGQLGMYHLAMEHLLAENQDDRSLAEKLQIQLSGGVALNTPLIKLPSRFAFREAKKLSDTQTKRREVEHHYNDLRQREAKLPDLDAEIAAAENAQRRYKRLEQAIDLHHAIRDHKAKVKELGLFPPGMDQLRGNEVDRLEELETRLQDLRTDLQKYEIKLTTHQAELERTGLEESRPQPEETAANEARLQRIREKSIERETADQQLTVVEAAVRDAIAQFNDYELAPSLNAESIQRSETIAGPPLLAQATKRELEQRLALAGDPPEQREIDQHRNGVDALRQWLATTTDASDEPQSAWRTALPLWIVLGAAAFAGLAAYLQNAFVAVAGTVVAIAAVLWALLGERRTKAPSPSEQARRSFAETDLEPPSEWTHATVRERLREIEDRLNTLLLQQKRAAGTDAIRIQIEQAEQELAELDERKETFVREVGFEPEMPVTAFDRFVRLSVQWDQARLNCARHKADIDRLDHEVMETAKQVGEFIVQWRGGEAFEYSSPDGRVDADMLRSTFNALKERIEAANQAQSNIEIVQGSINATRKQIASTKDDINKLFRDAGLAPDGPPMPTIASGDSDEWAMVKRELVRRIKKLDEWEAVDKQLTAAQTEEKRIRRLVKDHPDLDKSTNSKDREKLQAEREYLAQCLRWVRTGEIHQLERERDESAAQADALESLREQRTAIITTLANAGQDRALENALNQEMQAQATLEDKRDHAFLSEATTLLLDDVKQVFQAKHEPEVLRRARKLFREVTSHAFDFELGDDGQFIARDLQQEAPRTLAELSSGTRMQLLLALRLAWIQTQEQERGASPLPLFLDEALTTSDEERFKVMAQSLERLSEAEGRQIFYLSARRHEPALWQQATGNTPAVADLTTIRFGAKRSGPDDYAVETAPPVPTPDSRTPEAYAALLGVPQYGPHTAVGGIHLFHLLRDDLNLLHRLMGTRRIKSVGQLEALLNSSAAQGAIGDANHRQTLLNRCAAARHWVELWRQGRGKPVDRPALEQSGAVSERFINEATDLAAELGGNGHALIGVLHGRCLPGFWKKKIDELEQWLDEEGYIDNQPPLSADDRRRLTLQQTKPQSNAQAEDINQLIDWLEAALDEQPQ